MDKILEKLENIEKRLDKIEEHINYTNDKVDEIHEHVPYVEWMEKGWLYPNMKPELVVDAGAMACLDAKQGFGQIAGEAALNSLQDNIYGNFLV